ncbi:MAG: RICIN domain-containing protein, partial [Oscillospiraceae bacterium]|nr:RICIN domain-containing protein [Oscillospiraceae bacterium]
ISPACATGSLLDISGGASNKKDGANVQIYTAHWGTNQQFKATLKGNSYVFEAVSSGKALDASKTTTNVQQWATHSGNNQKWYLKEAGNGYYYVVSCANTNNYLDVNGAGNKNGTNVQIYPSNGTNAQKFKFILKDDDITWDTFFKSGQYIQTYALSNSRQIPVYSNANLSSPEKGRYIYGDTDLLYVYKVAKNSSGKWYAYVSYPTSGGRRKVYVPLSTITTETQLKTARSATAKITTYKKANNTSFGYIDKGDRLWYAGKSGNYTRVIYPVTNGYKMAFIKTTDYNNKTK